MAAVTSLPSVSQLEGKLKEVEKSEGLEQTLKASLTELYRRALANLESSAVLDAKAKELEGLLTTAPKETREIELQLSRRSASGDGETSSPLPSGLSAEEASQRLSALLADLALREGKLGELEKLLDESQKRPAANRERLIAVKRSLDALAEDLNRLPASNESPELAQARRWAAETQRLALWAEGRMLEQDLRAQSAREALLKAQRDQAALAVKDLKARQQVLDEVLSERRKEQAAEAQRATEKAQRQAEDKHPLVRKEILQNAEITDSVANIAKQLEGFSNELSALGSERKRIEDDFRGAKQRLEAAGLSKALGQILLDRRSQLPDRRQLRKGISEREDAIADATLRQIRYREEEHLLRDLERYAHTLIAQDASAQDASVKAQIIAALDQRKGLISQALKMEEDYIRQLGEINYATERVSEVAKSYDDFLAERLLWVRSAPRVGIDTITALPGAIAWLVSAEGWMQTVIALGEPLRESGSLWIALLVVAGLFWKLSAIKRRIRATAEPLRRVRTDGIRFTLLAIALSLLAALPLPLLFWLLGLQLQVSTEATAFGRAFGAAFSEVAFGLFCLLSFRMLSMSGGVADRHFRWSTGVMTRVRKQFDWFTLYVIPVAIITIATYRHNDPAQIASLGRLAMIANMLGLAVFFYWLLDPKDGVLGEWLEEHRESWASRLRHLWFPIAVGSPLALAVLATVGYVYTAGILFQSLAYQIWLALALVVIHQTIVRWLILTRRRLALQAALERAAARRAQAEADRAEGNAPSEVLGAEEAEPDLAALDEQTRRLINASIVLCGAIGLWLTWSDVLPAFSFFERFALWHYTGTVDGTEQTIPVTAADMGLVLLILLVATIAARNLPALLEILLLQSSSVSAGARYAIKTLASYSITAIAVLLAFSTLGLSWGQVQWLVAALSVGIGFGLQEIVANFISGLIILFERPVRVGDIVTIGDTTGVVTNIRIRATTIRNWDKQELLVPNKELITGRLLNWTLTDQQNRVTIRVGIEYGSDTRKALALLTQIAEQNEHVLKDPAPLISFDAFGDNALMLVLRCYLDTLEGRIGVVTELHQAIYDGFRANDVRMAFPTRDIHLHADQPIGVRLDRAERRAAAESRSNAREG